MYILYHQLFGLPVQTLERLIQDQKVIVSQQTTENSHSAPLSSGKLPGGLTDAVGKSHRLQSLSGFCAAQGWCYQAEIGNAVQLVTQTIFLEYCAEAETIQTVDPATVRLLQSYEDAQQGGFLRRKGPSAR